jgi:glycosyltransferase involved in cell wall biosynthesis
MNKGLVSIITPSYNREMYIHRFLDSVLLQSYNSIELIFVDDGSNDQTEKVVLSYKNRFEQKGFSLNYIYQENKGVSGAINTGLKCVSGEYLCWCDSDDYLEAESIEKRVKILDSFSEYAIVTSDVYLRDINHLDKYMQLLGDSQPGRFLENQFELMLSGNSMFVPGAHMVRMSGFIETNPDCQIYPYRKGQNWQMLLPVYFRYKRYFLDEPLFSYIKHETTSITGSYNTEEQQFIRCQEHEDTIVATLQSMIMEPEMRNKYISETQERYTRQRLSLAFKYRDQVLFKKQFLILKKREQLNRKEYIYNILINNWLFYQSFTLLLPIFESFFKIKKIKEGFYSVR